MTTDLSTLTTAAEQWDGMAKEFNKRETDYRRDVHGISMGQTWQGLSADAANRTFDITLKEFQNAQVESKAIASLLRDAHTQFSGLKKRLKSARDDATANQMKVSDQGVVTYDYSQLTQGEHQALAHDPDYQKSIRDSVASYQRNIDQCVKDVTDADDGVEIAFKAVVVDSETLDGTPNGFNGKAQGDIEKYEADEAKDIATRIDSGKATAADYKELQRLFRDNSDDKAFSRTLLTELGPDGTIKLTNSLNDLAYDSDKKNRADYLRLQGGLADTLATATQVPGSVKNAPPGSPEFERWLKSDDGRFYRQWTDGLDKYGDKNYGSKTNPLYGYQSVASMMDHSGKKYDDQFLYQLTDDMISAEKEHPGIFTEWGAGHDGIRADAIDTTLGVMSRNPDAATAFFDPQGNGSGANHVGNNHLHYLLADGDGTRDWPKHVTTGVANITMDDPLSRSGLGAALEAAATGHRPLKDGEDPWPEVRHNEAQARIMQNVMENFVPDEGTDAPVHENLRRPLADALAEYTTDTHNILGPNPHEYITNAAGEGYFTDEDGNTHIAMSQKDLVQVMRGLSEDPDAYATLQKAEGRYINNDLDRIPDGTLGTDRHGQLGNYGKALGTYEAIKEDVINDERMSEYSAADWKTKAAYHLIGGAVTPLYFTTGGGVSIAIGDSLQRGVDTWMFDLAGDLKSDADNNANAEVADVYMQGEQEADGIVNGWGSGRPDIDPESEEGKRILENMKRDITSGQDDGSNLANKYITDTSN
ncbi:MAG: hypothetical protein LBV60_11080 [Streptomyces sp.]|nr:hypothetical protein [Streptomyces sp.]